MRITLENSTVGGKFLKEAIHYIKNYIKEKKYDELFEKTLGFQPIVYKTERVVHLWNAHLSKSFDKNKKVKYDVAKDVFEQYVSKDEGVMCWASYTGKSDEGKLKLLSLSIDIIYEEAMTYILSNIENLELVKKYFEMSLRHELGHLLFYTSCQGMDSDEFGKLQKKNNEQYEEYYKKFWNEKGRTDDIGDERLQWYYKKIDNERIACEMGDVDIDEFIELDSILAYHGKNYEIDLEIITHSAKEID